VADFLQGVTVRLDNGLLVIDKLDENSPLLKRGEPSVKR